MKKRLVAASAIAALLLLAGCAADPAPNPPSENIDPAPAEEPKSDAPAASSPLASITSCDQVESVVAPYIEGLVPLADNVVDEWGVSCGWDMAENETDVANARTVTVSIVPVEEGTPAPDNAGVAAMEGGAIVEDAWVAAHDGVAATYSVAVAVAGAVVTEIWFPRFEISISGGVFDNYPSLDAPASLEIAKRLFPDF